MFSIREIPGVFVDAWSKDHAGGLLFMSCLGRDAALQRMLASFELRASQGGLDHLTLAQEDEAEKVVISIPVDLDKQTGRLPQLPLIGKVCHMFLFQRALQKADRVAKSGWVIRRAVPSDDPFPLRTKAWEMVKQLSPIPLLDHWKEELTPRCCGLVPDSFGIEAMRIEVPDDFEGFVSQQLKSGVLTEHIRQCA